MLLYLLGVLIPPLAILVYGKIIHAALNAVIWTYALMSPDLMGILAWICASIHASGMIYTARSEGIARRMSNF